MTSSGGSVQHRAVLASPPEELPPERRPRPGPIAVLPEPDEFFVTAVQEAGGTVAPLSAETRGVIWLSYARAAEFPGILERYPGIDWVQLPWAGVDAFSGILASTVGRDRPIWTSAKGAYAEPVAEHALALTLALLRALPTRVVARSWGPKIGRSLFGLDVVIVGAGGIAVELLRLLEPFRTRVTIVRRTAETMPGADRTVTADRLLEVLPDADVVIVAAAMTGGTAGLLGAAEFAAMKPTAILVNVARGGLVDTDALTDALASGTIAGAGLDVTDPEPLPDGHPLWSEPRALITSHSADTPEMTTPLLAERVKTNVRAFLDHARFDGLVDPEAGY
ncbi:D-isomer specific 2-hydroxyacid dehydrogenase family protein [Leifsonia bigeumensis]|uniref:D-isomer specific 2-hydroxyacid dehydrogenase family protein n=1 Tax=Leifsonella bigeumensis TaxID=433643 RepID=A0ABP7FN00_9MICO